MYKVNVVKSNSGVAIGERYCLTKRVAKDMIKLFDRYDCEYKVEKFVRCSFGVYCWSSADAEELLYT